TVEKQVGLDYVTTSLNAVNKTENVKITAPINANAEYSFWRLDANGYREVKSWSTSNVLDWKPMQAGDYTIQIRARDKDFAGTTASYEAVESLKFQIGGTQQAVLNVIITSPLTGTKRTPIEISASATAINSDNIMYRFEVKDELMGVSTIQGYSMDNTATFIPRKAGTYTIRVLAKDAFNFGYYDSIAEKEITIS
ncbi:MAG: hypothetical protein WCJ58_08360, partial [bacterium]